MAPHERIVQQTSPLQKLSKNYLTKDVKLPLASSLHEISKIIGA